MPRNQLFFLNGKFRKINNFIILSDSPRPASFICRQRLRARLTQHKTGRSTIQHVAFAQNRKFDGYQYRNLTAAELGQIAGRAGRHLRDGTFGVTGQVDPLDEDLVKKIEGHDFDPVKVLQWRTAHFDFASLDALKRSIETNAPVEGLTRALPAVDAQALEYLSRDEDIRALATDAKRVALLWEACALPDYRKIAPAQHGNPCKRETKALPHGKSPRKLAH